MKAEIVNCFIEALETTLTNSGGFGLLLNNKKALGYVDFRDRVGIIIKLFGGSTIQGKVAITMDNEVANNIVGSMLGGTKVKELNDIGISALGEYSNWIISSAAKKVLAFGEKITNFEVDIKTSLQQHEDCKVHSDRNLQFLSLGYLVDGYKLELSLDI
jgi:chemotaxis protein CheX